MQPNGTYTSTGVETPIYNSQTVRDVALALGQIGAKASKAADAMGRLGSIELPMPCMPMPPTQFHFDGFPVHTSTYMVDTVFKTKRWRRFNRPDKVRTRAITKPMSKAYLMEEKYLIMHPVTLGRLARVLRQRKRGDTAPIDVVRKAGPDVRLPKRCMA